jgi:hypothetical protein
MSRASASVHTETVVYIALTTELDPLDWLPEKQQLTLSMAGESATCLEFQLPRSSPIG